MYADLESRLTEVHLKLNIWTMGFIISPFISPFAFGFLVARARFVTRKQKSWNDTERY